MLPYTDFIWALAAAKIDTVSDSSTMPRIVSVRMQVTGATKLVGLFGYPVEHTLSPLIHNIAFRVMGIDWIYCAFPVMPSDLREASRAIRALRMPGVNITVPHKERIIDYLDRLSSEAEAIGAVNTVVSEDGFLVGYNTDVTGFAQSLKEGGFSIPGKVVLMIGAGGAALAVGHALVAGGAQRLLVLNRTSSRAAGLVTRLRRLAGATDIERLSWENRSALSCAPEVDLLVNTTSCGLEPGEAIINIDQFSPKTRIYDLVYNRMTELLQNGARRGFECQGGRGMLVHQGAQAFSLWTKLDAPVDAMRSAIDEYLGETI